VGIITPSIAQPILAEFWALVARQHGVISRAQLLALGFSTEAIRWRIAKGRLHPVRRGVYAVGRPELSRMGELMAAVLACGDGAALSHFSAAELWGITEGRRPVIEISIPLPRDVHGDGLRMHRRSALLPKDLTEHDGIPVTTAIATVIDIAPRLTPRALERAINEADKLNLFTPDELRAELERIGPRPGIAAVRELLDRHAFLLTDSELERRFVPITERAGLPKPLTRQRVNGFRVDFHWPDLGLIVETDGLRYHRTPAQQARDRLRDQRHTAAGLTPLRFTHAQIRYEPGYVEATLRTVARRLGAD
jgi:Transcriptional regulator, AbiEi antitoxin/Protein of unknown function (DUF559)